MLPFTPSEPVFVPVPVSLLCVWCGRAERDGFWVEPPAKGVVEAGGHIAHGICPECSEMMARPLHL